MSHDVGKRLTNVVYDQVKERILLNYYKPGDWLSENQIAKEFDVSRTPVREAMKMLSNENFVDIHNGAGILIKIVTLKEITDIFQVREILECNAMTLSWDNITKDEISATQSQWDDVNRRIKHKEQIDATQINELDVRFHQMICEKCPNRYLTYLVSMIKDKVRRFQLMSAVSLDNTQETVNQHIAILRLIKKKEKEATLEALKNHIRDAMKYIVDKNLYMS